MKLVRLAGGLFAHGVIAFVCLLAASELAIRFVPLPQSARLSTDATLVYAEDGKILAGLLSPDERWRFTVKSDAVDPGYLAMLTAYEDRNFWKHRGVDLAAAMRAGAQAARHQRIISGGSTLTMQLVRLLEPRQRGIETKLLQALQAIKLERHMSKAEILDAYLNVAPFGGNIEGIRAASLIYLGKEPDKLSLDEAALLVAVPQSPELRRPDRSPEQARLARDRVLSNLAARGLIDAPVANAAALRPLALKEGGVPQHAPNLVSRLNGIAGNGKIGAGERRIDTLLDLGVQAKAEEIARDALRSWDGGVNIAIVVMRNDDGAVVGYVGSGEPGSKGREGYVDLVRSIRSPGSTLKPFIFAMAFEQLIVHPDTIVADQPVDLAGYRPQNADGTFSGDLSIRQSLILSKNTVPVMLLHEIGTSAFLSRFRTVGSPMRLAVSDGEAGLAVALGGIGISLEQLTWFYSAFANEGELKQLRFTPLDPLKSLGNLFEPEAANAVADILADVPPPAGSSRLVARDGTRRIGFKTGTSYGFRDAWAVGFDKLHTVGVWIGRPDGAPHLGAYGVSAAAPVLMQVFDTLALPASGAASGHRPLRALASPRSLPDRLKRFGAATASQPLEPLKIVFPKPGAEIAAPRGNGAVTSLPVKVSGGRPPYSWSVLGKEDAQLDTVEHWITIAARGQIDIAVTDADGKVVRTSFWLD